MKNLILILLFSLPLISKGQQLIELSINNEDKAIGISYIDLQNHLVIGAESGTFKYSLAKVEHQKYKLGYSVMFDEIIDGQNNLLITSSLCYNLYNVIYNDQIKRMPRISCEIGVRSNLTDRVYCGFQVDVIHRTGGFNVSFIIFK